MLYSTQLIYLAEVYNATGLRQFFSPANNLFQCQDWKNNLANIFREYKKKMQMHPIDLVVAFSSQRFLFCSSSGLRDAFKIGVVIDKEYSFYLLLSPPLHCILTCICTCILAIQMWGHTWDRGVQSSSSFSIWFMLLEEPFTIEL